MALKLARVYYVRGGAPSSWRQRYDIQDPPTSGFSLAVLLPSEKRSTLFCPFTLYSYSVRNSCGELAGATILDLDPQALAELVTRTWMSCVEHGFQRDFGVAAMVLNELGHPVPKFLPTPEEQAPPKVGEAEESKRGGKAIVTEALRPMRRDSKRGQVAAFFAAAEPQSLHEGMAKLGMSRSGILSHLFTINKDHGLGYELVRDYARLIVPEGFDLFAVIEVERPEQAAVEGAAPVEPREPKRRAGGKPINPAALKPIPEPGKRATVAHLFVAGWHPVAQACESLGLDRSAVLSHLFTINKENGLGYELSEDGLSARLLVPEGHIIFGEKQSRAKKEG